MRADVIDQNLVLTVLHVPESDPGCLTFVLTVLHVPESDPGCLTFVVVEQKGGARVRADVKDRRGQRALHYAAGEGNLEVREKLDCLDCLISGIDCLISGIDCLISGLDCLIAGLDCLKSSLNCLI